MISLRSNQLIRLPVSPGEDDELPLRNSETAGPNPCFIAGVPTKVSNCLRRSIVLPVPLTPVILQIFPLA